MDKDDIFSITFWGVRGSIPSPGPDTARYGGNTTCFEIRCGEERLIIDGGSGLRDLGKKIIQEGDISVDLLLTHTHWDHICGIPFFQPAYHPGIDVRFWAGHLMPDRNLKTVMCDHMIAPFFPVPIDVFQSCHYHDYAMGAPVPLSSRARVTTCPLNHPNRACGYRIDYGGHSICVITDTEHIIGQPDQTILRFVDGCDIMVYDAMFSDDQFSKFVGWGHSTWQEAIRIAQAANVAKVVLFHHDPNHHDDTLDAIGAQAEATRAGTLVAREGLVLTV